MRSAVFNADALLSIGPSARIQAMPQPTIGTLQARSLVITAKNAMTRPAPTREWTQIRVFSRRSEDGDSTVTPSPRRE
jgi:hypothetical protein